MRKTIYTLSAITIFMMLFVSACAGAPPPPVATSAPVESAPTQVPPTAVVEAPTQEVAPTTQAFAPACQAVSSCTAPDVQEKPVEDSVCISKVPWQNFLVPEGTVFEYLPKEGDPKLYPLICKDTGAKQDGKIYIGCHGAQLWQYDVKVTNPSCGASTALQTGTAFCADGQGYDEANNCCTPLAAGDSGSVIIKVNLGGCPSN